MRGHIMSVNVNTGTGTLQADTGGQYLFHAAQWQGRGAPPVGQPVSFRVAGNEAIEVAPVAATQGGNFTSSVSFTSSWNGTGNAGKTIQGLLDPFGAAPSGRQSFWAFYFSPSGRVSLGQYWFNYLLPVGFLGLLLIAAVIFGVIYMLHHNISMPILLLVGGIVVFKFCILAWVSFVMHLKRMHDLNMSWGAGYVVDNFVPLGRDWMAFRMMCQQGTLGPNDFGDDPR